VLVPVVAELSVHVPPDPNVPVPPERRLKEIVPPGLVFVPVAVVSVTVAVQVVAWSTARDASAQETTVDVDRLDAEKVTVKVALDPRTALHGFVVPVQVELDRSAAPLHPLKLDPAAALALNVTVAPFAEVVMFGKHVLETVWEAAAAPVPPQVVGALIVPVFGVMVTDPVPVPAKVKIQFRAAISYGPTTGPPPGAPEGTTSVFDSSPTDRPRLIRPFPAPPSESEFRARRPTIDPGVAYGSTATNWAAAPATIAADIDVPVTESVPPPTESALMSTPGAVRNTAFDWFEPLHSWSVWSVAPTPTTFSSPAG
jgi:hypothetical protein